VTTTSFAIASKQRRKMMSRSEQPHRNQGMPMSVAVLFAVLTMFGAARNVSAQQWANNGNNIYNTNSGNVGVGTSSPADTLSVAAKSTDAFGFRINGGGQAGGAATNAGIHIRPDATKYGLLSFTENAVGDRWVVGIKPSDGNLYFSSGGSTFATASDKIVFSAGGSVGIGTTSPRTRLQVDYGGISNFTGTSAGVMSIAGSGINYYMPLDFRNSDSSTYPYPLARMAMQFTGAGSYLHFGTSNSYASGITNTALTIDPTGNVGVGHSSPTVKLDVNGNAKVTGDVNATGTITGSNIVAKYQDVAEWVPSTQKLTAGTVVVLDAERGSDVIASAQAYDTKVAGVVSARPGLILGEAGEDKVLIATTGRVRVKVEATRAPIRVGDLLVTSDRKGHAMRSEPIIVGGRSIHSPGTLIGKAMEPLEKGVGEIMVLLSLQ
jgi:hypothetical protein